MGAVGMANASNPNATVTKSTSESTAATRSAETTATTTASVSKESAIVIMGLSGLTVQSLVVLMSVLTKESVWRVSVYATLVLLAMIAVRGSVRITVTAGEVNISYLILQRMYEWN